MKKKQKIKKKRLFKGRAWAGAELLYSMKTSDTKVGRYVLEREKLKKASWEPKLSRIGKYH